MNDEINEPLGEMSKEELEQILEEAIDTAKDLHDTLAAATEDVGYAHQVLASVAPRYMVLLEKAEEDASVYPILYSGAQQIKAISSHFQKIDHLAGDVLGPITPFSNSTGTVSLSTDAAINLYDIELANDVLPMPPLMARKSREEYSISLKNIDPPLADTYEQVWQIYFGTNADKCRASLFMMRQVFDHFFAILAPDDKVRESEYWKEKGGDKPNQIYRSERIRFAAHTQIKDVGLTSTLSASSKHISELYKAANRAHTRGLLNEAKAEKALHAMHQVLMDWIDAII
jgi:hypothetical protein